MGSLAKLPGPPRCQNLQAPLCTTRAWMWDLWYLCFGLGADPVWCYPSLWRKSQGAEEFQRGSLGGREGILSTSFGALLITQLVQGLGFSLELSPLEAPNLVYLCSILGFCPQTSLRPWYDLTRMVPYSLVDVPSSPLRSQLIQPTLTNQTVP